MAARSVSMKAILVGGALVGVLDGLDAVVALKVFVGLGPIKIYQFVASGLLGPAAFAGGGATALLGLFIHFLIAFTAAWVFVLASARLSWLARDFWIWGPVFGLLVWAFMNLVVIPLSRVPPSPFSLPLFLNGVIAHVLFVGLPIAYAAYRYQACQPDQE